MFVAVMCTEFFSFKLKIGMWLSGRVSVHNSVGHWINPTWWTYSCCLFQPVLHNWCSKGLPYLLDSTSFHVKDLLLLIKKINSWSGSSGFPLSVLSVRCSPVVECLLMVQWAIGSIWYCIYVFTTKLENPVCLVV